MKIYELKNNYDDFSHFMGIADYFENDTWGWRDPLLNKSYKHEMVRSNKGLKNFKLDLSCQINYLIISDKAKSLFEKYGTFFDIETDSKRKGFKGFFPNKCIISNDFVDFRISDYELRNGKLRIIHPFFKPEIQDIDLDLFVIEGNTCSIYVTDTFKKVLEDEKFKGFSFNAIAYDSDEPDYIDWKFNVIKNALSDNKWSNVIRSAYNFNGNIEDFESIINNRYLVEEQPFLEIYEKYKDLFYVEDSNYPNITKYEFLCIKNEKLLNRVNELREFSLFLKEKKIFKKSKYIILCPKVKYFDDGVMVGGHFVKGLRLNAGV